MGVEEQDQQNIQASEDSVAVGSVSVGGSVDGSLIIGSHNVVGFTSDQVSTLITEISTTFQVKPFDGRCPYKGLETFNEEDAELFFGREKWIENLLGRVKESRALFVTGQSGSGKSSLVRAGLIPCLKAGYGSGWLYATMKPGRDPVDALANAFSRLKDPGLGKYLRENAAQASVLHECTESALSENANQRLVLFIDQFEEVFTQLSKDKAQTFINLLDHAATVENGRVIVLFSMRSDFVPNCATYPQLNAILNQQFMQIGAMEPEELVSAIAQPALRVGLKIDPDLIAQIINDMKGEPGALPLMQFALKDLFDAEQAKGGMIALTLSDYLQRGGINQALERHANASLETLTDEEKEMARNVFSGLIEIGRGTQDTRRTALSNELIPAGAQADAVKTVVQKLANARLITTDATTVTISHEKLIDAWPWLKKLVNENRDVIALQNEIAADAKEWEEHKRDSSYLYSGARLATAREKMTAQKLMLSGLAQDFIEQSIALQEAERKARETLRRRIIIGLVSGIVIALILAASAVSQSRLANKNASTAQAASTQAFSNLQAANTAQADAENQKAAAESSAQEAQKQAKISRVGELAAQSVSLREKNFLISLLMGVEAYKHTDGQFDSIQAQSALLDNAQASPQLEQFLHGHSSYVFSIAFSPDGKTLASGSGDKTIILWDVATGKRIGQPLSGHSLPVMSIAFSPDGKTLASGSGDKTIILWDLATRQPIGQPLSRHSLPVMSIAFSPDGKTLASGSKDGTIILWDLATRRPIGQPLSGHSGLSIAFSPDGKTLASGGIGTGIELWDMQTHQRIGQPMFGHSFPVLSVAFSPDGKTLASSSEDATIRLWDVETGKPIGQPLSGHSLPVPSVAFSPGGKTLASSSWDTTVILWDLATHQSIGPPLRGHSQSVRSVAFSPDGKTLASGSDDNTIILWDVASHQPIGQPFGDSSVASKIALSPNGKMLASSVQGIITLWDVETRQSIAQPWSGDPSFVSSTSFSPDGKMLASGSCGRELDFKCVEGKIVLWNLATRQPIGQPLGGHSYAVTSVAFSPDGKTLASGSCGRELDLKCVEGKIVLWNLATRQPIGQPLGGHSAYVSSVAFSPDGKTLASGSDDNTIILWNVEDHQPIGQPFSGSGHSSSVSSVAFSPDGKTLASGSDDASNDNTIILWDIATHQPVGQPLGGHLWGVLSLVFRLDGKTLASGNGDNTLMVWDLNPRSWLEKSCQRAGRNFTHAEWAQYFPNEEYRKTCEQWPLEPEITATPTVSP